MSGTEIAAIIGAFAGFAGVVAIYANSATRKSEARQAFEMEKQKKIFELEFSRIENISDEKRRAENARLSAAFGRIYGYLWKSLFQIDADRVSIIQPHPLADKKLISVSFEIVSPDRGIASHKAEFQQMKMSEWSQFVARLSGDEWLIHLKPSECRDRKIYAEMNRRGVKAVIYKRLTDPDGIWIGTLCAEYVRNEVASAQLTYIKDDMKKKAILIQDLLPEYMPLIPPSDGSRN